MLRNLFALTEQGAKDMKKRYYCFNFSSLSLMFPMGLLLMLVMQLLQPLLGIEADGPSLKLYSVLCIGLLIIIFLTHYVQYRCTYIAAYAESAQRRIGLAEKLRTLPLSFFGKRDLSDLTTTMMSDCSDLERVFAYTIPQIFGTAISCLIVCLCLFFIDWRMALAILSPFILAIIVLIGSKRLQNRMDLKKMQSKLDAADSIQEFLESIRDLQANNQEEEYLAGLDQKLEKIVHTSIRYEMTSGLMITSAQMILRFGFPVTVLVGTLLLSQGHLSLFLFLMFLVTASRIYDPLSGVMMQLSEIFNAMLQLQRMKAIEKEPEQTGTTQYSTKGYDISFSHVGFSYQDGEDVLTDVTFTAKQGEVTALVGPSGGGKSTTAKLAARFWDIQKGSITIGGTDISKIDPETLLKDYAIVFQDVVLFNDTIMGNIRLGRKDATNEEILAAARAAQCDEFVQQLPEGYQTVVGENGSTLSGGERQRISIARALLKNAPVVLLDEATASLDVENETSLQTALSALLKEKTVLIIAHRMRTVMGADHVVVLADGHVAEEGTPKQLLDQGRIFRHMVELQQESSNWKISS
ncbi:MAG: ABC transporter ATP-binding protein [Oscillospiraceae bacterium]